MGGWGWEHLSLVRGAAPVLNRVKCCGGFVVVCGFVVVVAVVLWSFFFGHMDGVLCVCTFLCINALW